MGSQPPQSTPTFNYTYYWCCHEMNPNIKFNSPSLTEDSLNQPPQSRPHKNLDPLFHSGIQKPTRCLGSGSKRHAGNGGITANYVVICKMAMTMHCIAKGSSENMHIFKFPNGAKPKLDIQGGSTVSLRGAKQELLTLGNTW